MLEVDARRMHFCARRNIDALLADVPPPAAGLFVLTDASADTASLPVLRFSRFASATELLGSRVDCESVMLGGYAVGAATTSFDIFTLPHLLKPFCSRAGSVNRPLLAGTRGEQRSHRRREDAWCQARGSR